MLLHIYYYVLDFLNFILGMF